MSITHHPVHRRIAGANVFPRSAPATIFRTVAGPPARAAMDGRDPIAVQRRRNSGKRPSGRSATILDTISSPLLPGRPRPGQGSRRCSASDVAGKPTAPHGVRPSPVRTRTRRSTIGRRRDRSGGVGRGVAGCGVALCGGGEGQADGANGCAEIATGYPRVAYRPCRTPSRGPQSTATHDRQRRWPLPTRLGPLAHDRGDERLTMARPGRLPSPPRSPEQLP